jgi:SAM-dependent methyltransferase
MFNTSKICDAADWFDPEVQQVIQEELKEPAKLHRKQWEFAMIFLTLCKLGLLTDQKTGLSLGGGNERVLYSIARHIKKLIVTDLYDNNTSWDCARTTDPDEFIKANKPFPVDDEKLQALKMDMRFLDFAGCTFDFCYSSCAIEHIGDYNDFLQHFNEVNRVLKDGGIYVLTTELQFGERTIADQNNFIFEKEYLSRLISESDLDFVTDADVSLARNRVNYPFPSNIRNLSFTGNNFIAEKLFNEFPHLFLLKGNVPFTSVLLVLRKGKKGRTTDQIRFINYASTKKFLLEGVDYYRNLVNDNKCSIMPFSMLPDGVSKFFIDHSDYFIAGAGKITNDNTIFHSDYFWLGNGRKEIIIKLKADEVMPDADNVIQLRVHSYSTHHSSEVKCIFEKNIKVKENMLVSEAFTLNTDEELNFTFLCKLISGDVSCSSISIECSPAKYITPKSIFSFDMQGVSR